MSRLFYTCPIKAAYMAKEFGVKLHLDIKKKDGKSISSIEHKIEIPNLGINRFKQIVRPRTDGSDEADLEWVDTGEQDYLSYTSGNEKIFVAKESEHIFEPKEGDFGIDKTGDICEFGVSEWIAYNEFRSNNPKNHNPKIIIREGKEFFMPEVENENL